MLSRRELGLAQQLQSGRVRRLQIISFAGMDQSLVGVAMVQIIGRLEQARLYGVGMGLGRLVEPREVFRVLLLSQGQLRQGEDGGKTVGVGLEQSLVLLARCLRLVLC